MDTKQTTWAEAFQITLVVLLGIVFTFFVFLAGGWYELSKRVQLVEPVPSVQVRQ